MNQRALGDNAHMESFFHSLKAEIVHGVGFDHDTQILTEIRSSMWHYGARMLEHPKSEKLAPGVWLTGPVARRYPEHNWGKGGRLVARGGLHLLEADEKSLTWTAEHRLRVLCGLDRGTAVVGAVGSGYSSTAGLDPRWLAR